MSFLNTLPAALYRLAANVFLGAAGIYVLHKVNYICIVQIVSGFFSGPELAGWFSAVILLVVLVFLGEIIALLGEALIHPLFGFPSFKTTDAKDFEIENVTPCAGSRKLTAAAMSRAAREQGAFSFSEIHFVLSRILAGTAWLLMLAALVWNDAPGRIIQEIAVHGNFLLVAVIILLGVLLILPLSGWMFRKIKFWLRNKTGFLCIKANCLNIIIIKGFQVLNFFLSATLLFCLYALSKDEPEFSFVFILLASFLIINAILYRSFANVCNLAENAKNESGGNQS